MQWCLLQPDATIVHALVASALTGWGKHPNWYIALIVLSSSICQVADFLQQCLLQPDATVVHAFANFTLTQCGLHHN